MMHCRAHGLGPAVIGNRDHAGGGECPLARDMLVDGVASRDLVHKFALGVSAPSFYTNAGGRHF